MTARQKASDSPSEGRAARRAPRSLNPDVQRGVGLDVHESTREADETERQHDDSYRPDSETYVNLPGGGWAQFMDPDDLTNADRKMLRKSLDGGQGGGESTNKLMDRAAELLIEDWSIIHKGKQLDMAVPSRSPNSWDHLPARIAQVIEARMTPILDVIKSEDVDPKARQGIGG